MPTSPQYNHPLNSYSYSHINTKTSTLVKTGPGILHSIVVNTIGAAATTLTVYDGLDNTGSIMAVPDTLTSTLTYVYDIPFATGLCLVTATGTAADLTVTYI